MKEAVEPPQPGHVARRLRMEHITILLHIPGWSSRTNIIDNEPKNIDQQKGKRKAKEPFFVAIEQVPCERKRKRDPAEITDPRKHIQEGRPAREPVFIERMPADPKPSFIQLIKTFDPDGIIPVIRKSLHGVKEDPENDKDCEAQDKAPGSAGEIE